VCAVVSLGAIASDGSASLGGVKLVCPVDRKPLQAGAGELACPDRHRYPQVGKVAVLLRQDVRDSHPYFDESRRSARERAPSAAGAEAPAASEPSGAIDPFVQQEIVKTNGILYRSALGTLTRYPIPAIPLPEGGGARLLDIGCNWGRWSIAASRRGYRAIGLDPGLGAVEAAYRVSGALQAPADFVVSDGRNLPFPDASFDVAYSYSVLQHFSKEDARACIREAARVTRPGGTVLIQLANLLGVRQLYNQARDLASREQGLFRVRRWTPNEMLSAFKELVGPARLFADGFFSLNAQATDIDLMAPFPKLVVRSSEALKGLAARFHPLTLVADSVFVSATRAG
jgi:SAM-dependent methyltransferase